ADAVFLGDSMIYGHGVEGDQTVPARFAARTELATANLGQQGTCLVQMWLRYRRLGAGLRPRLGFVCSHPNDVEDAHFRYPREDLRRFAAAPPPGGYEPFVHARFRPKAWWKLRYFWSDHLAPPLRAARVVDGVQKLRKAGVPWRGVRTAAGPGWDVPTRGGLEEPVDPSRPGWAGPRHAPVPLQGPCDRQGARLVPLDLGYPHALPRAGGAVGG